MLSDFFQLTPAVSDFKTVYNINLVLLSYIVASIASYVALDITSRMRDIGISNFKANCWLVGGSFAMGAGLWSMHFIGMLAFIMPMPMSFSSGLTLLSMIVAIISSGIAFSLLRPKKIKLIFLILGGIILGCSMASMHYIGMAAMDGVVIHYWPSIFLLSIAIAIFAAEVALYLALKSTKGSVKTQFRLKIISALIMGIGICGVHYTGMFAAVFSHVGVKGHTGYQLDPTMLAVAVAMITMFILISAVAISSFQAILSAKSAEVARKVGMSEVASNVLHNVGNALNSVNVSSSIMLEHLKNINLHHLKEVNNLLAEHKDDLSSFITNDERGTKLPIFLDQLTQHWDKRIIFLKNELKQMRNNIEHIKTVISMQQKLSGLRSLEASIPLHDLIEESIILASVDIIKDGVTFKKNYSSQITNVTVDKSKLTQILINLIRNAKESVLSTKKRKKEIEIKTGTTSRKQFYIEVIDNGAGISSENLKKIFSHGFTTKVNGHGFGLHASCLAAIEMGGVLTVDSKGENKGACFRLNLPIAGEGNLLQLSLYTNN